MIASSTLLAVGLLAGSAVARGQDYAVQVDINRLPAAPRVQIDDGSVRRLTERAIACIERNAAAVEAAETNMSSAVTFLVSDLCGREVAARERYKRNSATLAIMQQQPQPFADDDSTLTAAQKASILKQAEARLKVIKAAKVDPDSGEIVGLDPSAAYGFMFTGAMGSADAPPDLRALAAERLLASRRARLGR